MKYYKVYAQCVNRTNPIIELSKEDAYEIIKDEVNHNEDYGLNIPWNWEHEDPEDDTSDISQDSINSFYETVEKKALEVFEEMKFFNCGDYKIVMLEDNEKPVRPNVCGTSMATFIEL